MRTKVISLVIAVLLLLGMAAVSFTVANASANAEPRTTRVLTVQK